LIAAAQDDKRKTTAKANAGILSEAQNDKRKNKTTAGPSLRQDDNS
jgi:hypothetical protein